MPKMSQEIKEQWVRALRSGKYEQTNGILCEEKNGKEGFCCLGVLFDIAGGEVGGEWKKFENVWGNARWHAKVDDETNSGFVPIKFKQFVKLSQKAQNRLVELNDTNGKSFNEIADWIEKYL